MNDGSRPGVPDGASEVQGETDPAPRGAAGHTRVHRRLGDWIRFTLEYVTFGYSVHHLLKVAMLQFALLFLDVDLLGYTRRMAPPDRPWFVTATWAATSTVFLLVLVALVRQIGRRTLTPRFHRRLHLTGSIVGYLLASGLAFGFGYVTFLLPNHEVDPLTVADLLPVWLLTVVFATFIAIGYHAQIALADHPSAQTITDVVVGWLDSLAWVEDPPNSLARERAYERFVKRTDEIQDLLTHARTIEARRLELDVAAWRDRFEAHSMLSRALVIEGHTDSDGPESSRLAAEREAFVDLRRRLEGLVEDGEE